MAYTNWIYLRWRGMSSYENKENKTKNTIDFGVKQHDQ